MKQTFLRLLSWQNFYRFMQQEMKVFFFFLMILCVFRVVFIGWMHVYIGPASGSHDILTALWVGMRISCKSAGMLTLLSLLCSGVANVLAPQREMIVRCTVNGVSILVMSILFVARFPYYQQFHSGFNQLMFNTANDDVYALTLSLVQEFYLPVRLAGAFLLAFFLYKVFVRLLRYQKELWHTCRWKPLRWIGRAGFLLVLYCVSLMALFGGSLGWQTEVDWENAGVTKDTFLNEAILDDLQAVYRAYAMNGRMEACNGLNFDTEQIRTLAAGLVKKPADSDNLDMYLTRQAHGMQVEKPRQIFIIISESYANWPLLDKYKDLHIADGMKSIMAEEDSDYCGTFLPDGASTVSAVTGIVTGFADANLYLTTMPEAFAAPYPTASAPQLERLGYRTNFWYAGPSTWERIGAFTQAQGFAHFYSRGDFKNADTGSVWGCDDEYLYKAVLDGVSTDTPSFNVVLNVSNHSPFNIDLEKAGFDKEALRAALPVKARKDEELIKQLGHYWYADKEMAAFIRDAKEKYPNSLFIVIGDHADRYNIDKTPSMYERYGIPFIVTGKSVKKGVLGKEAAGSQIDVVPTLIEMIAPQGFEYESLGSSLSRGNKMGVNYGFWITHDKIGKADILPFKPEIIGTAAEPLDEPALQSYIDAVRSISWWRAKYGPILDDSLTINRK
ncbi:MAG: LTA synthase family protein [Selenomonadaceae bacterium]